MQIPSAVPYLCFWSSCFSSPMDLGMRIRSRGYEQWHIIITLTNQKKIQNSILISPRDNKLLWPEPILIFCQSGGCGADQLWYDSYFLFSLDKNTVPSPQMSRHTQSALFCLRIFLFCQSLANKTKVFPIICIIVSTQLIQFSAGTKRLPILHSQTPAEWLAVKHHGEYQAEARDKPPSLGQLQWVVTQSSDRLVRSS